MIDAGAEGLLCVFNDDRHAAHAEALRLPGRFSRAVDVSDGRALSLRGNRISVQVPPEDVRVFHLSAGGMP